MGFLHDRGFHSKTEKAAAIALITVGLCAFVLFLVSLVMLLSHPLAQLIFGIIFIPAVLGFLFLKDTTPELKKTCTMCDMVLKPENESKTWKGAHEWCECDF